MSLTAPTVVDQPADNVHTIGQMYYGFSTIGSVPTSKSQQLGLALGAPAGLARLFEVLEQAWGFREPVIAHKTAPRMVIAARKP